MSEEVICVCEDCGNTDLDMMFWDMCAMCGGEVVFEEEGENDE
jgi:hypothetical protein